MLFRTADEIHLHTVSQMCLIHTFILKELNFVHLSAIHFNAFRIEQRSTFKFIFMPNKSPVKFKAT